jgi:signal transduction histidine kinase
VVPDAPLGCLVATVVDRPAMDSISVNASTTAPHSAGSTAVAPSLEIGARRVATALCHSTGAWACYLALSERTGGPPRLVASSGRADDIPPWRKLGGAAFLRQAITGGAPLCRQLGAWPAAALPLDTQQGTLGAAVLLFEPGTALDLQRIAEFVPLAALALDSTRQAATLHLEAAEVAERIRLREIQLSRNLIRGVIDGVPMGLTLLDATGSILAVNRALAGRFNREPAALVGRFYGEVIGEWDDAPAARTFITREPNRVRRTLSLPDGSQQLLEIASIPLLDQLGEPHQVVEVWEDITERVSLQTQLVRVEKLAAIGQLAASIAHEVGNPLQAIQGFLALFLEQCPPDVPNQHFLRLAEEEIERIVQVLARLRDLYRPRADVARPVQINELIEHVLLLTSKQLERVRIRTVRELAPTLPEVYSIADQIKQVLLNLVLNAAEAMAEGGLLHLQTYTHHDHGGQPSVVIAVTDTGVGIPAEQLARIFDGLHTTKERGMGLGLYTSKVIVERHMGRITVESLPGEGTTFTITLPVSNEHSQVMLS